jgi:glycosyltransferase involved in cell wall biosynthesis
MTRGNTTGTKCVRVCHFTSVHPFDDVRVFQKECRTLVAAGFEVHLVAVGAPDGVRDGVRLHGVPERWRSRLGRMARAPWVLAKVIKSIDAEIYHFHDPELIPVGLWLRSKGKHVVYDAHEDLPRDLYSKGYLGWWRFPLRWPVEVIEDTATRFFSGVVAATPFIDARFSRINSRTVNVNNYPLQDEFVSPETVPWAERERTVTYIGVISGHRGIFQMVQAMELIPAEMNASLQLVGRFARPDEQKRAMALPGWRHVRELGQVSRSEVVSILGKTRSGVVIFQPEPNHVNSQPNKLFEYMAAGLPVIASDFPLWQDLVASNRCGLVVDPLKAGDVARAIEFMLSNPDEAEAMGRRGRQTVVDWCNWEQESRKLVAFYRGLCDSLVGAVSR